MDDEEVELAEQEEYERSEEQIKKRRDSLGYSNKKKIQKALNVLGQDPFSEKKLESKLGVAIDTINNAVSLTRNSVLTLPEILTGERHQSKYNCVVLCASLVCFGHCILLFPAN